MTVLPAKLATLTAEQERQAVAALAALLADHLQRRRPTSPPTPEGDLPNVREVP